MEQKEEKIPSHTRFGLRLLQVLIIVLAGPRPALRCGLP